MTTVEKGAEVKSKGNDTLTSLSKNVYILQRMVKGAGSIQSKPLGDRFETIKVSKTSKFYKIKSCVPKSSSPSNCLFFPLSFAKNRLGYVVEVVTTLLSVV